MGEAALKLSLLALEFAFAFVLPFVFESVVLTGLQALTRSKTTKVAIVPNPTLDKNSLRFSISTSTASHGFGERLKIDELKGDVESIARA